MADAVAMLVQMLEVASTSEHEKLLPDEKTKRERESKQNLAYVSSVVALSSRAAMMVMLRVYCSGLVGAKQIVHATRREFAGWTGILQGTRFGNVDVVSQHWRCDLPMGLQDQVSQNNQSGSKMT